VYSVEAGAPSVFDHNHAAARADLAKLDVRRRIQFYRAIPGQKVVGFDRWSDRSGDSAYDGDGPRLRLNGGWAGRSGRRKIHLADLDRDGRLDLLVNGTNVNFLRNVGDSPGGFVFRDEGKVTTTVLAGHDTSPAVAHLDGDATPDLLVGAEDGRFYFLSNPRLPKGAP
jgi:hypothetical protein